MVEAGQISIGGDIDTQGIETGLGRIEQGFEALVNAGRSVNADFVRMNQQTQRLQRSFKILSVVGPTAMVGIAKNAPAVSGAIAKMAISFGKLSRTLGMALKPAFDIVAESFQSFVGWVEENRGTINEFATNTIGGLTLGIETLAEIWGSFASIGIPTLDITIGEGLKWLVNTFGAELIAGLIAAKFGGPVVGVAAAGIVAVGRSESEGLGGATIGGATGAALGTVFGPAGIVAGFGIGALIGRFFSSLLSKRNRKDQAFDEEYLI